ncbi:MAG: zinc-ribbon domain-containing protein [Clostridia bacterium]|nr:zinc-ribbon domain-containing protein [Clostridia bacterium]
MRICPSCGKEVRDGAAFCTSCGATMSAGDNSQQRPVTTVPLLTLAPQNNTFSQQRLLRIGKMIVAIILVTVVALGAVFAAAWLKTDPFKTSSFEEVETDKYRDCLALVADIRNENFNDYIEDIINMTGDMENYNFLKEYESVFKECVPDEGSTEMEIKFRNCCFMTAYAEFTAKKYEYYSNKGLFGMLYVDEADKYRIYADELWAMINDAKTDEDLQKVIDYCSENVGISLKDTSK